MLYDVENTTPHHRHFRDERGKLVRLPPGQRVHRVTIAPEWIRRLARRDGVAVTPVGDPDMAPAPSSPAPSLRVPPNWRDLSWPERRNLASQVAGHSVRTADEAESILAEAVGLLSDGDGGEE